VRPWKLPKKAMIFIAPGGPSRQLDGALDGFGARIAEGNAARHIAGRDRGQLFRQRDQFLVIEIGARHVDQARGLLLDGFHHPRMAVARWPPPRCRR
jgi:hypothetical protein